MSVPFPVLLQWHVKALGHSAKSAGGGLHLDTHTPLTQRSRSGLTMPLSRHSVGTTYQGKGAHTQLVSKHLAIFTSARLATVTDSGLKKNKKKVELV